SICLPRARQSLSSAATGRAPVGSPLARKSCSTATSSRLAAPSPCRVQHQIAAAAILGVRQCRPTPDNKVTMTTFAMNYAPLMTSFLVREAGVFRDDPVVLLDVGARGGVGREWEVFGDQLKAYAFEPNEEECRHLAAAAPANLKYIPRALGRQRGRQTLYETAHPDSAGLYRTAEEYLNPF